MNRGKRPMSRRLDKKMQKEIRLAQSLPSSPNLEKSNTLSPAKLLKKYPQKFLNKNNVSIASVEKTIKNKKEKCSVKNSKRTTPSLVNFDESSPSHPHKEGERWIKTVVRQNISKGKQLMKRLTKRK